MEPKASLNVTAKRTIFVTARNQTPTMQPVALQGALPQLKHTHVQRMWH